MTEPQDDQTGTARKDPQQDPQDRSAEPVRQQGVQPSGTPADGAPAASPGEQMTRALVRDVAAFEVDPPPPARVEQATRDAGGPASAE